MAHPLAHRTRTPRALLSKKQYLLTTRPEYTRTFIVSENPRYVFICVCYLRRRLFLLVPLLIVRALWKDLSSMTYAKRKYNDNKKKNR